MLFLHHHCWPHACKLSVASSWSENSSSGAESSFYILCCSRDSWLSELDVHSDQSVFGSVCLAVGKVRKLISSCLQLHRLH